MRRNVVVGALAAALLAASCSPPESPGPQRAAGPIPDKPAKPVTLNILDVAGNLQLTQGMIDQFVAEHPDIISEVTYSSAPAPDLIGKVKSQQNAGRVDIGLVLTGVDGMSAGIEQGLWEEVLPKHADRLPGMKDYLEPAAEMQKLAQGYGVTVTYYPSGPLIEYLPSRVPNPPRTAQELLDYAKAHPGKVEYARPSNSGPGRTFLMGLPYILGDSDPRDPVHGWEKTWDYLAELNSYIDRYPSGTTEIGTLEGFHWVTDAHYAVIPKGATADQQAAALQLIQFMLTKEQQAKAYDEGYFYPGPAVKGVDISMAPESSQEVIRRYGRPEYDQLIADNPKETPLDAKTMVAAFDRWDREIGGAKVDQ